MTNPIPALIKYQTENEYYQHFCKHYCDSGNLVYTFDGIKVDFYPLQFNHAFRESAHRQKGDKSVFSQKRAERIDWIKWALNNPDAELFEGWNTKKGYYDSNRRVCIVIRNYVVIIQMKSGKEAFFVTAYIAEGETLRKIRNGGKWRR